MRYKYYRVVRNMRGDFVEGARVGVYLSGTNVPVRIYLNKDDIEYVDTPPQVVTGIGGVLQFWVDSDEYDCTQRFKLVVEYGDDSIVIEDEKIVDEDYLLLVGGFPGSSGGGEDNTLCVFWAFFFGT